MKTLVLVATGLLASLLLASLVAWNVFTAYLFRPTLESGATPVELELPSGVSPSALAATLAERGVITEPAWFELYLTHVRREAELRPGTYALSAAMSPREVADKLARGATVTHTLVVRAGMRLDEVLAAADAAGITPRAKTAALVRDPQALASLNVPSVRLEGFVGVDAYTLPSGLGGAAFLRTLTERFLSPAYLKLRDEARAAGLVEHDWVVVASLLETSGLPEREWPSLAGLYWNRVRDGLPLEHVGALAYGLERTVDTVGPDDRRADTPYNTFTQAGLPPTAVACVGLGSLAAAKAAVGDARYVAARDDGTYHYCPDEECQRLALADGAKRVGLPPLAEDAPPSGAARSRRRGK